MHSVINLRRKRGAVCSRCNSPGYECTGLTITGRPEFRCTSCGDTWTNGHYGEPYIDKDAPYPEGWVGRDNN